MFQDNSSPNSNNSGNRTWQKKPQNSYNGMEFYGNRQQNDSPKNGPQNRENTFHQKPRYNNGGFNQYQNSQYQGAQGYQQSYSPPLYGQGQMNGQGRNNYGK